MDEFRIDDNDILLTAGPNDLEGGACTAAGSGQEASLMSEADWWSFLGSDPYLLSNSIGLDQSHHLRSSITSSDMSTAIASSGAGGDGGDGGRDDRGGSSRKGKERAKPDIDLGGDEDDDDDDQEREVFGKDKCSRCRKLKVKCVMPPKNAKAKRCKACRKASGNQKCSNYCKSGRSWSEVGGCCGVGLG